MERQTERRRYYRIDDLVGLSYRQMDEARPSVTVGDHSQLPVDMLLTELDRELNQAINLCWQQNPLQASALGLLNKKLSLIASQIPDLTSNESPGDETQVNISGCGMAFDSPSAVVAEDRLLLCVTLRPSNTQLKLQARVVDCTTDGQNRHETFRIRVEFENCEAAQEMLIQHIVQKHWGKSRQQG
ncbi:MAG: PilZ domain-containing protein [Porticoccaceae bacterium]